MSEWQPIETAPRDGSVVLMTMDGRGNFYGRFYRAAHAPNTVKYWEAVDSQGRCIRSHVKPTNWLPPQ